MGLVVAAGALAIVFNVDQDLQTRLGSYSTVLQKHVEETSYAQARLADLRGGTNALASPDESAAGVLPDYGPAPEFRGIERWLNTAGERPLSIAGLRGKVVLLDFWTYSCINCIRTLPHLRALYSAYHAHGLEIVGVHTPEFAFEHVLSNVRRATHDLNVTWPVALDNSYGTWNAYSNQYWPAEYLDRPRRTRAPRPVRRGRLREDGAVGSTAPGFGLSTRCLGGRTRRRPGERHRSRISATPDSTGPGIEETCRARR